MADKLIMEIFVEFDGEICALKAGAREVVMIPFTGTVRGEFFNGHILHGGTDTQRVNLSGVRHMSARYMLEGQDFTGTDCRIFVENEGWFEQMTMPFKTVPTFITDSAALAPYLHQNRFRGEGHPRENGVCIRLFETDAPGS